MMPGPVKIRLLRTVIDTRLGHLDSGKQVLVSRRQADQLIGCGAAIEIAAVKLQLPVATKEGAPVPLASETMRGARSSSLRRDRAQPPPTSDASELDPSSSSMMRGDSIPPPPSSTPAIPNGGRSMRRRSRKASEANDGPKADPPPTDTD